MSSNFAARAATSPELTKFRGDGQACKLHLAIQHPATVYSARINQTFTTLDAVAELTYDGGTGTLANVFARHDAVHRHVSRGEGYRRVPGAQGPDSDRVVHQPRE